MTIKEIEIQSASDRWLGKPYELIGGLCVRVQAHRSQSLSSQNQARCKGQLENSLGLSSKQTLSRTGSYPDPSGVCFTYA